MLGLHIHGSDEGYCRQGILCAHLEVSRKVASWHLIQRSLAKAHLTVALIVIFDHSLRVENTSWLWDAPRRKDFWNSLESCEWLMTLVLESWGAGRRVVVMGCLGHEGIWMCDVRSFLNRRWSLPWQTFAVDSISFDLIWVRLFLKVLNSSTYLVRMFPYTLYCCLSFIQTLRSKTIRFVVLG